MRYRPKSAAALQIALGGLPNNMRVEVDPDVGVSAKTVGDLRNSAEWSEHFANNDAPGALSRKRRENKQG
jgi:hypothetical protein